MKKLFLSLLFAGLLFLITQRVYAAGESACQIVYGGGVVCPPEVKFTLNKLVQTAGKGGTFVENIGVNDLKLQPGQTVNFQIILRNTGEKNLTNVQVVDTLPQFLTFVAGSGNFDANKRTLTFTIDSLEPNAEKSFIIVVKVVEQSALPADQGIVCVLNHVKATDSTGSSAEDSAQVCIEKVVLGVGPLPPKVFEAPPLKVTPPTGPEMAVLPFLVGTGALGWFLRKKA